MSNYFEDVPLGEEMHLGQHTFTAEEIKAFAAKYDPQYFHLDEAAAKSSLFGGLCASGWHTAAIWIRLTVAYRQRYEAELAKTGVKMAQWGPSPGFKNLKWLKPVFAGDTITFTGRRTEKVDLKSRPHRGIIYALNEGFNQHGEKVFEITSSILVERRQPYQPKDGA
ncbi:MAG: MaoC family dehydratase [Hyphomicrobiaceae bacterium]